MPGRVFKSHFQFFFKQSKALQKAILSTRHLSTRHHLCLLHPVEIPSRTTLRLNNLLSRDSVLEDRLTQVLQVFTVR